MPREALSWNDILKVIIFNYFALSIPNWKFHRACTELHQTLFIKFWHALPGPHYYSKAVSTTHLSLDMGHSQHIPLLVEPKFWFHSSHNMGLLMVEFLFLFCLVSIYNGRQGLKLTYFIHVKQWGVSPRMKLLFSDRCDPSAIAVLQCNSNVGSVTSIVKDSKCLLFEASSGSSQETGEFDLLINCSDLANYSSVPVGGLYSILDSNGMLLPNWCLP